jgi:hypothetical protein
MKKIFVALLLFVAFASNAQVIQKINTYGAEYKRMVVDSFLRIALDSLNNAPDGSISFVNHAFYMKDTMWKLIVVPTGTTTVWGTIGGTIGDQSDLMTLLNAKVPKTTTLTINGTAHDLSTNQSWGPFLVPADTIWLHNAITTVQTYTNSLTFSGGLHQVGSNVVALHDEANWNAYKFQGRFVASTTPLNGQVYVYNDTTSQWVPRTVSGGSGTTPTIAEVLAAGHTLLNQNDLFISPTISDPNANLNIVIGDTTYSGDYNNLYSDIGGSYNYVQDASNHWSEADQQPTRWEAYVVNPDSAQRHIKITDAGIWMIDGTQGAGKVWTSDASGLGHWETASGGSTPDLQAVTAVGNETSYEIKTTGSFTAKDGTTDAVYVFGSGGRGEIDFLSSGGQWNYLTTQAALSATETLYLPNTGNTNDTIVTAYDLRQALSGVGGGSTRFGFSGEDVTSTGNRSFNAGTYQFYITRPSGSALWFDNTSYEIYNYTDGTHNSDIFSTTGSGTNANYTKIEEHNGSVRTALQVDQYGVRMDLPSGTYPYIVDGGVPIDTLARLRDLRALATPTINSILAASGSGNYLTTSYFVDYGAHNNILYEQDHYRTEYFMEEYFRFTTSTDHGLLMYDAGFMPVMRNSTFNITQNVSDPGYILNGNHTITMIDPTSVTGSASGSGQIVYVYARPSSFWTISGATVQQPDATAITSFVGGAMYMLMWSTADSAWIKMN